MANKFILVVLLSVLGFLAKAQVSPYLSTGIEWTAGGSFVGGSIGLDMKNRLTFEGFYQRKLKPTEIPVDVIQHLYGGIIGYTFFRKDETISARVQLRGGYENTRFFFLWPALYVDFRLTDHLKGYVQNGIRFENPSIGFGISYDLASLRK